MRKNIMNMFLIVFLLLAAVLAIEARCNNIKELESLPKQMKSDFFLQQARDPQLPYTNRLAFYDSIPDTGKNLRLALEKGQLLEDAGRISSARRLYEGYEYSVSKDSLPLYLRLQMRRATTEFFLGNLNEAVKRCYDVINTSKDDSLLYHNIDAERLLSHLFMNGNRLAIASKHMERARTAYSRFKKSNASKSLKELTLGKIHYTLSTLAVEEKDFARAFDEIKKMRTLLKPYWPETYTNINLAVIFHEQGELEMAERFYKETLESQDRHPNYYSSLNNYIMLLISQGRIDEAVSVFESHTDDFKLMNDADNDMEYYNTQFQLLMAKKDTIGAFNMLVKNFARLDSINRKTSELYIGALADKYEGLPSDSELDTIDNVRSRYKIVLIITTVLIILAISIIIVSQRQNKKTQASLVLAREELDKIRASIESDDSKRDSSINKHNQEMLDMTMHMTQINTALNKIEKMTHSQGLSSNEIVTSIRTELKKLSSKEHVWEMFKVYFEEVNQRFFDDLFNLCPELTNAEVRMCAFIRSGMNTKEIAATTNRSVRTVDCIKYNIRRKLGITEPTEVFIRRISARNTTLHAEDQNKSNMLY